MISANQIPNNDKSIKNQEPNIPSEIKMTKKDHPKKKWTEQEDMLLINITSIIGCKWKFLSKYFPNKTLFQLHQRYIKINPNIKKGRFSEEEDRNIISLIKVYGFNWMKMASIIKNRTSKQIRSRYINFLKKEYDNSEISEVERQIIFSNYPLLKNKWNEYNHYLEKRRSPNFIRNILFPKCN